MPSGYVIVFAHGGWNPASDTPQITVPEDTQVYYLVDGLKTVRHNVADVAEWDAADIEKNVQQWVYPDRTTFNLGLSPDKQATGLDDDGALQPKPGIEIDVIRADTTLGALTKKHEGKTIVIAACRYTELEEVGGKRIGVNVPQYEVGDDAAGDPTAMLVDAPYAEAEATARGSTSPGQGVVRCEEVCQSCYGQCRWYAEHTDKAGYLHECEQGHRWGGWDHVDWDQIAPAIDERNRANLKDLSDGDETFFVQAGDLVLIGEGHEWAAVQWAASNNPVNGRVRIKKGGMLSSGKLYVEGSPNQAAFEEAVGRISDKTCVFE